jgi:hypothetical protein
MLLCQGYQMLTPTEGKGVAINNQRFYVLF